jgi:hypothetical protein
LEVEIVTEGLIVEARHRFIWRATLLLFVGLLLALAGSAKAKADCMTPDACFSAADWQKAVADDSSNKAAWFRAAAAQNFVDAKQWGDKATFAFHAGDATAAAWYKAIADDYAHKAVANSKAADNYAAQAKFIAAAAVGSVKRAAALLAFYNPDSTPQQEAALAQAAGDDPDTLATASTTHCTDPKNKTWGGWLNGGANIVARPSMLCVRGNSVLSVKVTYDHHSFFPRSTWFKPTGSCSDERSTYNWRSHGSMSGLKVKVTCTFNITTPGIGPIPTTDVGYSDCQTALFFHSNGSHWYDPKVHCHEHPF